MTSNPHRRDQRKDATNWSIFIFLLLMHMGVAAAFFTFSWMALASAVLLWWVSGSLGIGMGYHRLLTHRGYKTSKAIEYFLAVCGTLALQGGPIPWVATHRLHHMYSDEDGDPHSPRDGKWWSHMGWMLAGETIHNKPELMATYAPDLAKDKFHVWLTRWHLLPSIIVALLLYLLGGWPFLVWGFIVRVTFWLHATALVNSATHIWGRRRFETGDNSRNNWWVALLTFGEGWHNNHHAHPTAARHGLAWYELDLNWIGIRTLQLLGLARSVKLARLRQAAPVAQPNPYSLSATAESEAGD
ncbi:MAG TPA: fatty acid desaturase [Pyrinomonadaceae bacterium]|jgi:stearoyl-CoA desaturase (delta-9 desaturase)